MAPRMRRVVQALLYELVAISLVTPAIAILFEEGKGSALGLSVLMSSIALAWNSVVSGERGSVLNGSQ